MFELTKEQLAHAIAVVERLGIEDDQEYFRRLCFITRTPYAKIARLLERNPAFFGMIWENFA